MTSYSAPTVRDFVRQATAILKTATASEYEAFHMAIAFLAWAKLSCELPLLEDEHIATVRVRGLEATLQSLLSSSANMQRDDVFAGIIKVREFDPAIVDSLVHLAETLAMDGLLDHPSIDDLMPSLTAGAAVLGAIPTEICDLMVRLCELSPGDAVYTPWDFFGHLATLISIVGARAYLETPIHSEVPKLIQILMASNIEICYTDPIVRPQATHGGLLDKFDASLAFPPLSARYNKSIAGGDQYRRFPEKTAAGSVLTLRHLLAQTTRRIVVSVPNSLLFSSGAEKSLREYILKRGMIRAVIAMPEGLLESATTGFAVLVLDPPGGNRFVNFVDASAVQFQEQISKTQTKLKGVQELVSLALNDDEALARTGDSVSAYTKVAVEDLCQNDSNLQVNRHVLPASKRRLLSQLSRVQTFAMRDLVATVRPISAVGTRAYLGNLGTRCEIFEVGALDLPAYGFISSPPRRIALPESALQKFSTQFLQPYDIVVIVKGSVGKVGIVPSNAPAAGANGWVVGQSGIVLRLKDFKHIDPSALYLLLRSPLGQALLAGVVSGATTPLIQLRELLALKIPVPTSDETQRAIYALEQERKLQDQLALLVREQAAIASDLWRLE